MGIEPESWNKDQGFFVAGGFNGMDDHQAMFRPPCYRISFFTNLAFNFLHSWNIDSASTICSGLKFGHFSTKFFDHRFFDLISIKFD